MTCKSRGSFGNRSDQTLTTGEELAVIISILPVPEFSLMAVAWFARDRKGVLNDCVFTWYGHPRSTPYLRGVLTGPLPCVTNYDSNCPSWPCNNPQTGKQVSASVTFLSIDIVLSMFLKSSLEDDYQNIDIFKIHDRYRYFSINIVLSISSMYKQFLCKYQFKCQYPVEFTSFVEHASVLLSNLYFPTSRSGLSGEEKRGVRPVYLRCSEGRLRWNYPEGALRVLLRLWGGGASGGREFRACLRPAPGLRLSASVYLEGPRSLNKLYAPQEPSERPHVRYVL
ncbi:unnamed protein product, partial [Nesidiocoris tenuis]